MDFLENFDLDLDFFKSLISDFDLMALLPDMADVMEWIMTGIGYAVVLGPVLLAFMGLWYLLLPAREANHFLGYRFFWGMGSVKSWKFTQRFAGLVWAILGLVLAMDANEFREAMADQSKLDLMYQAIELVVRQIFWVVVISLSVNLIIFILFNFKGEWRKPWQKLGAWVKEKAKALWADLRQGKEDKPRRERRTRPEMAQPEEAYSDVDPLCGPQTSPEEPEPDPELDPEDPFAGLDELIGTDPQDPEQL